MRELLVNKIRTPDGTELTSRHRHDFVQHTDKNGKSYFLDGGLSYQRIGGDNDYVNLAVYSDDPIEVIREHFEWGTYGKEGTDNYRKVKLKDMSDDHIKACLENLNLHELIENTFKKELRYREVAGISVKEFT